MQGFALTSGNGTNGILYSGINSPPENASDNDRFLPQSTKVSSNESSIEYSKRFLPPEWVDIQEDIENHLQDLHSKSINPLFLSFSGSINEITTKKTENTI